MAGIGFALRRLAREDTLNAGLRSQAQAVAVSSGPWLLTVVALGVLEGLAGTRVERDEHRLFSTIVVYNFAFSLVLTAPVVMVVTRRLGDMLFARDVAEATGLLMGALGLVLVLLAAAGTPFYGWVAELTPAERVAAVAGFLLTGGIWLVAAYLSALKSHASIGAAFLLGLGSGCWLAFVLAEPWGAAGMLGGFALGLAVTFYLLVARVLAEYPRQATRPLGILAALRDYGDLALAGLLLAAAVWVDKWIMWFAPGRQLVAGAMPTNPTYDSALFLACLTMVPSAAVFLVLVETRFFEAYLRYYRAIAQHATAREITANHAALMRIMGEGFRQLVVLQCAVAYVAILAAPGLIGMARGGAELVPTFRFGVLGAACNALLIFVVAALAYFDLRRELMAVGAAFLVLNATFTLGVLQLGPGYAGYGYFAAALVTLALAYAIAARRLAQLPFLTFVASNRSLR